MHSSVLGRDKRLRYIVPTDVPAGAHLPVVYLLHGAGSSYRDWSNCTEISSLAAQGFVLVMPETDEAFALNELSPHRHYEDYFLQDVMPAVGRELPYAAQDRAHTAIVGISRGGLGATVLALHHPDRFGYVAALSAITSFGAGRFTWKHPFLSALNQLRWGPAHSPTRLADNPFRLLHAADPSQLPYFFLTVGAEDRLLPEDVRFGQALARQGVPHDIRIVPGEHHWSVWAAEVPMLSDNLRAHLPATAPAVGPAPTQTLTTRTTAIQSTANQTKSALISPKLASTGTSAP